MRGAALSPGLNQRDDRADEPDRRRQQRARRHDERDVLQQPLRLGQADPAHHLQRRHRHDQQRAAASRSATTKTRKKLAVADRPVKTETTRVISTTRHVATSASVHKFACTAPTGEKNRSYGTPYSSASGAVSQNSPRNARYSLQNVRLRVAPAADDQEQQERKRRAKRRAGSTNATARGAGLRRRTRAPAPRRRRRAVRPAASRGRGAATRIASRFPMRNPSTSRTVKRAVHIRRSFRLRFRGRRGLIVAVVVVAVVSAMMTVIDRPPHNVNITAATSDRTGRRTDAATPRASR